ncbi:MAG: hypothetical protein ABIS51_16725 [Sphingomonas sp.]
MGAAAQARELVQNDAVSILVYGDAAAFDLDTRRALLASLDRDDPYFLGFDTGATALGALASDDFADTLIAVLEAPDDTHRLSTVFEVLLHGRPLELVRPVLRRIALDPARPEWQRTRAIAAWLNSDGDGDAMRRDLFDALGVEARSPSREMLRAQLLAGMSDAALRDEDVRAVLTDYTASSDDSVSMRLYGLGRRLRAAPRLALLDVPLSGPVEEEVGRRASMEIDRLLDEMLAAAIQATTDLRAGRLWRWTVNVREDRWDDLGDAAGKAARAWLESDARRRRDFIDAIIDDDATEVEGGGAASHLYFHVLGQWPESDVIRHLMSRAEREAIPARRERLLVEIVEGARRFPDGAGAFDTVYEWLSAMPDEDAHFQRLKMSGLEAPRTRSAARARRIREASVQHCRENVAACTPHLEAIRSGEAVDILADFARIYFLGEKDDLEVDGRDQIEAQSDAAIADAVIVGLKELALGAVPFTPRELGIAEGRGETYAWELAALAGVDLLLARDPPTVEAASPALALVVLRQLGFVQDDSRRSRLDHWACQRLDLDMVAGAQAIVEQWEGLRGTRRSGGAALWLMPQASRSSAAMGLAIERMLTLHPDLPPDPLHMLLVGAAERLSPALIDRLADAALAHPKLPKPARAIWSVVKFALGGDAERERLRGHRAATIEELLEAPLGDGLLELLPSRDDAQRAARLAAVIRIIGPKAAPENSRPNGRLLQPYRKSDAVHAAIRRLSGNPDPVAGRLLLEFIGDAKFGAWHLQLRHARAQHLRILRDTQFVAPSARMVLNALAGKGPANAADLRAIVVEEMGRLARELRTDSKSPWRFYWNTNHQTKPVDPKNENLCRDLTLSSLQERLKPYGIPVAIPEATHGLDTRADMLMTSGAGRKMPVEAKRHYHKDLWSAASEQLQGYAAAEGADGNGMLLVYWFGADWAPTPARTDARTADSARELGELLVADLSEGLRERTDVVVFDVSRPEGGLSQAELARERRASAPAKRRRPKTTAAPAKPGRRGKAILAGTATKKAAIGVVAPRGDGVKQPTAPDTEVEMPNGEGRRLSGTPAKSPRSRASKGQTLSGEDD